MLLFQTFVSRSLSKRIFNMSSSFQVMKNQADMIRLNIQELKSQFLIMNEQYNKLCATYLRDEQRELTLKVEEARKKLIAHETRNGILQIPVPDRRIGTNSNFVENKPPESREKPQENTVENIEQDKPKKEKKPKVPKPKVPAEAELPIDVGRLDLRIAKIEDVKKHPDADTLYVLKINCGEEKPRTVCSGLVQQIPIEELKDRFVVLLCNLKPVKMRGITSEAMVMCACSSDNVEVLIPPENCQPGDLVYCDGFTRQPDDIMNPKKKIFETVAPDLHTNENLKACYKGVPFTVPGKGDIVAKSLKNVPVK